MSIAILPTPQASLSFPAPRVTASTVLGWAFGVVFFVAWLVVLGQAALLMRAELRLGTILTEADQFAQLPSARPYEIVQLVEDRLGEAGWQGARVRVAGSRGEGYRVEAIEMPAGQVVPEWLRRAGAPEVARPLRGVNSAGEERWWGP